MKLAHLLQERAELNQKIQKTQYRLENNLLIQEGQTPSLDPSELLKEIKSCIHRLKEVIYLINETNQKTIVKDHSLTYWIAEKDVLKLHYNLLNEAIITASNRYQRSGKNELIITPTVDVKKLQKEADLLAKKVREIDLMLQEANWTTEI